MKLFQLAPIALCLGALSLPVAQPAFASGGTGGGGTTTTCDTTPVLPTTAPAPGIIMRESFGPGAQVMRPTGGKGCNKPDYVHTPLSGFWNEYPGNKNTVWLAAPETGQTWRFCAQSVDPFELPSPLQPTTATGDVMNGCVISDWFDPAQITGELPTAIVPFKAPATAYEASVDGWPGPILDAYVAIGFTDSTLTINNLQSAASIWLLLRPDQTLSNWVVNYEFRLNGMAGPLVASGQVVNETFNRIAVRYDPVSQTAGASLNGVDLGSAPLVLANPPKFVGIEGVGILDNFVVRTLP